MSNKSSATDRIPTELMDINEKICRKFKLKKIDGYRHIASVAKPMIFVPDVFKRKEKKGQLFDIVTFAIVMIVFVLALGIGIFVHKSIQSAIAASETDANVIAQENTIVESQMSWWDFSFALFFFMLLVVIFAMSFTIGTNQFFIMIYLGFLIILGILFVALHNTANTIMQAFPTVFSETSMPFTYFIVSKMYYIMIIFFLLCFASLFMKPTSSGGV